MNPRLPRRCKLLSRPPGPGIHHQPRKIEIVQSYLEFKRERNEKVTG